MFLPEIKMEIPKMVMLRPAPARRAGVGLLLD